jgi:hypothetical protein
VGRGKLDAEQIGGEAAGGGDQKKDGVGAQDGGADRRGRSPSRAFQILFL